MTLVLLSATGCSQDRDAPLAAAPCDGAVTAIQDIQGAGDRSPLLDTQATTRGVVTRVEPGTGVYIEGPDEGGDSRSRGLFVSSTELSGLLRSGQHIEVRGRVAELGDRSDTLTALIQTDAHTVCAEDVALPATAAELPLDRQARESLEGMRLSIGQPLVISDVYSMHRGEWAVSTAGPLRLPTEEVAPGRDASELARLNRLRELKLALPGPDFPAAPVGAAVGPMRGVLGHDGEEQRFFPENTPTADAWLPRPIDPPAPGHIRIVGANLLNYFNGDGRGGGFPTERGAETPDEFRAQQERTRAAFESLQPDLLAVQELENDGFGPDSAAQSLLELLSGSGEDDWAFIDPGIGKIGGDVITVGLLYRRQTLTALGPPHLLQGPAFDGLSRQPLAQLFRDRASGETILVASNHLKSKGRCPDQGPDSDQGDGQGCWNAARVQAVQHLTPWLAELARQAGTDNILILGDMNAWRQEDPIRGFRAAGYIELVEELSGLPQHSFLYFGQRGTLDYAFASPALRRSARQAVIWHINADWPQNMPLPEPWLRMSDHDPVVVDVDFSHAATSD
jgi:predicted extracellular nuclease